MSEVVTAYEDDDFCVKVEEKEGILFLHCYVDNYSKTVKKRLQEVFEELKDSCILFGWEALHAYTPNPKFSKMFEGGTVIDTIPVHDKVYEVIRWELIQ